MIVRFNGAVFAFHQRIVRTPMGTAFGEFDERPPSIPATV
jgi:hypothetical protein